MALHVHNSVPSLTFNPNEMLSWKITEYNVAFTLTKHKRLDFFLFDKSPLISV